MDEITLRALSKINLGLDVCGVRDDGYHQVRMVMQTLNLFDLVEIKKTRDPGIRVITNLYYLPANENNLAYRAAAMLQEEFGFQEGIQIRLTKRIPVAGGMAGGSTDAAAVLFGINRLLDLKLSRGDLLKRGLTLGADVPYCLMRGTMLAEGIGEKLTRLPGVPKCHVLIAKPPVSVSTKAVYQQLDQTEHPIHPDMDALIEQIRMGDLRGIGEQMGNTLESVTIPMYPVIQELKDLMKEKGAINAQMSGSGPTVFGLFEKKADAKAAGDEIRSRIKVQQINVTSIFNVRS